MAKKITKKKTAKKMIAKTIAKKKVSKKVVKKPKAKARPSRIGDALPDFSAPSTGGTDFHLSNYRGKVLVLYFYPKDSTPGCTIQGGDFTRLHSHFKDAGAEVFGISRDSIKSHENFKAKQKYSIDLLSDANEELCKLFDVIKEKNMYGKKVLGIERSTFVIDGEGRLIKEWRGVKVPGHVDEVLAYVRTMPVYS